MNSRMKESDIQKALVDWLNIIKPDCEYFSVPNEATFRNRGLRAMGVKPGVADLVFWGMPEYPVAFVELKLKNNSQTRDQEIFEERCLARNIPYHLIATSDPEVAVDRVGSLLRDWGAL